MPRLVDGRSSIPSLLWGSLVIRNGPIEGGQDTRVRPARANIILNYLRHPFGRNRTMPAAPLVAEIRCTPDS